MLAALSSIESFLMRWTLRAAMALLVLTCCVSLYQVVTRFVFEEPSTWSEVTARSLNIWMVYLGVAVAFRTGALMAVEFLFNRLHGGARVVLIVAISGLSLGVLLVMAWYGWDMAVRVRFQMLAGVDNPFTGEGISIALVYAAVPVGSVLAIVGLLARTAEQIREALHARASAPAPQEVYEV
ncbi:TRAP transporter small permease [Azospirillum rugosum]|uniref:TRAP transporter small permease protein n=1 Tax=Azospirillum rugosum TaxID=416170 RepID=A0ABS4SH11_9PROT|nr:TRAP transporter small permease [Azospirillum rugosum]MBP2291792.1 TRAP-type C4-dicarboxylate transport system permease small subunit [Azospirillum rugosum]MDQ0524396.1 TRAP-type C4-dicarboxylate transport system permease small subunit [Azospirillum rugosum]